ncbi:MAG: hypothetical protein ACRDJN_26825, partial [Chloroflexota bacterium]
MLIRRRPFVPWLTAASLLGGLLLANVTPAAAQAALTAPLAPIGGSSVQGSATIAEQADGGALLSIDLAGLSPGAAYRVQLHAGTCALPSASAGLLGTVMPDAAGEAHLRTDTAVASAAGARVALSLRDVADGDHVVAVRDAAAGALLACGAIPGAEVGTAPAMPSVRLP